MKHSDPGATISTQAILISFIIKSVVEWNEYNCNFCHVESKVLVKLMQKALDNEII